MAINHRQYQNAQILYNYGACNLNNIDFFEPEIESKEYVLDTLKNTNKHKITNDEVSINSIDQISMEVRNMRCVVVMRDKEEIDYLFK